MISRLTTAMAMYGFVALGRKNARLCFVLLRKEVDFHPNFHSGACKAT